MHPRKFKILLVEDHAMVREGLKRIIAEAPDLEVAGEAEDASGAFKLLRENRWDVACSTSHCPGRAGWRC